MDTQREIVQPDLIPLGFIPNAGKKREAMKAALDLSRSMLTFFNLLLTTDKNFSKQQEELFYVLESEGILRRADVRCNRGWLKEFAKLQKRLIHIIQSSKSDRLEEWVLNLRGLLARLDNEDSLKHFGRRISEYGREVVIR
jgi:hypothetical protein